MDSADQHQQFDRWVREHGAILHHVVNGFAEGDDRRDLMQEVLLAVWRSIPAFREQSQVPTFLYRVTHNAAMTWRRRRRNYGRRMEHYREMAPEAGGEAVEDGRAERMEALYAAIRSMAPVDRSLMLLSLDGLSYREMAVIHGLSESNVGARLCRLKQKLTVIMREVSHEF